MELFGVRARGVFMFVCLWIDDFGAEPSHTATNFDIIGWRFVEMRSSCLCNS